ncbi:hypothetical protein Cassandra_0426 [Pseudomonas phage Cassandra]|nr:hypothetical protein Cassandra_0426 [Pseudomonas phage Cassandra]
MLVDNPLHSYNSFLCVIMYVPLHSYNHSYNSFLHGIMYVPLRTITSPLRSYNLFLHVYSFYYV